jgi:hypothetical protein
MRRLVVLGCLFAVSCVAAASGAASALFTAKRTTSCLTAHQVISNPAAKKDVLPPGYPAVAALEFTFAMIPAQAVDHGTLVFERNAATAQLVATRWIAYSIQRASHVQGIDQNKARARILSSVSLRRNVVTLWDNEHVKPASRVRITGCLR